jgi:hypothetical protein
MTSNIERFTPKPPTKASGGNAVVQYYDRPLAPLKPAQQIGKWVRAYKAKMAWEYKPAFPHLPPERRSVHSAREGRAKMLPRFVEADAARRVSYWNSPATLSIRVPPPK